MHLLLHNDSTFIVKIQSNTKQLINRREIRFAVVNTLEGVISRFLWCGLLDHALLYDLVHLFVAGHVLQLGFEYLHIGVSGFGCHSSFLREAEDVLLHFGIVDQDTCANFVDRLLGHSGHLLALFADLVPFLYLFVGESLDSRYEPVKKNTVNQENNLPELR
jgi:hypothetical protein